MLKITDGGASDFTKGVPIAEAEGVRVSYEINGARTLTFTYPENEKSKLIRVNMLVLCEGQAYRVIRVTNTRDGRGVSEISCSHIWNADATGVHIQNMPDMIGVSPTEVIRHAIAGTGFTLVTDSELERLGMRRVDSDGFKIDYFSTDKTNPYDVVRDVIECCGKGELYADNRKIALVERIGHDTTVRLDLTKNMCDLSVERDISDLVTRLYPYGRDDLHIGSVNGGAQYVDSPNAEIYGVRCGYRDYGEITKPDELLRRARWEFDGDNPDRIDVPCVNVTGTYAEISKLECYGADEKLSIGDGVTVVDGSNELYERVVKIEYSPYDCDSAVITVGRVKRDMFFYLEQMGALTQKYKKASTSGGKVKASYVAGTITNGVISKSVTVNEITIGTNLLSTDSEGNLLLNGKRIFEDKESEGNEQDI